MLQSHKSNPTAGVGLQCAGHASEFSSESRRGLVWRSPTESNRENHPGARPGPKVGSKAEGGLVAKFGRARTEGSKQGGSGRIIGHTRKWGSNRAWVWSHN